MIIADLDGDYGKDLIFRPVNNAIGVMFGQAGGTFGNRHEYGGNSSSSMTVGDWNGDGRLDLAAQLATTVETRLNTCLP